MSKKTRSLPRFGRTAALLVAGSLVVAACSGADDDAAQIEAAAGANEVAAAQTDESDDGTMEDDAMEDDAMEDDAMEEEAMEDEAMEDASHTVTVTIENIAEFDVTDSGAFAVPASATEPGPVLPGDAYEFSVYANPGQRLSFATMFVQSNDWFFAPAPEGIALYDDDGNPISGDVTDQVLIFDSGTEIDQPVGEGADQAPRQAGPDTGDADPDDTVRQVEGRSTRDYIGVVITPGDNGRFDVRIQNDSSMASVPTPIAPGVYAVHSPDVTLFDEGSPDAGLGLEALAEDGDPAPLADALAGLTGTPTPLAPGAYAVHSPDVALFELGGPDAGLGLEAVAEDGDPAALVDALGGLDAVVAGGAFTTPDGADEAGPLLPGNSYSFEATVGADDRLSFATMFVQSNDWLFATPAEGLSLDQLSGDITDALIVIDSGTEVDQEPGFGPDQAPRQAGPDTGDADPDDTVRIVEGRDAARYIRVTVENSGS